MSKKNFAQGFSKIKKNKDQKIPLKTVVDLILPFDLLSKALNHIEKGEFAVADDYILSAIEESIALKGTPMEESFNSYLSSIRYTKSYLFSLYVKDASKKRKIEEQAKSVVYFFIDKNKKTLKIGTSINWKERLKSIQTTCSTEIDILKTIPGDVRTEREWHHRFAKYRLQGEWFTASKELLMAINEA